MSTKWRLSKVASRAAASSSQNDKRPSGFRAKGVWGLGLAGFRAKGEKIRAEVWGLGPGFSL